VSTIEGSSAFLLSKKEREKEDDKMVSGGNKSKNKCVKWNGNTFFMYSLYMFFVFN